ncbi:MAG: type II secretion system protein [Candidatus Gastranaerophilaceae bacterium]
MNKDVKKAAFTMAETLLTLAIIGVVMALMLEQSTV